MKVNSGIRRAMIAAAAGLGLFAAAGPAFAGADFDRVKQQGFVRCGASMKAIGFSYYDSNGMAKGFDVDFCRAISAAMFGVPDNVRFVSTTIPTRFVVLQTNEVDVQLQTIALTILRDTTLGLTNVATLLHNGLGIMVAKDLNIDKAEKLDGATLCIQQGTTMERAALDFAKAKGITIKLQQYDNIETEKAAFYAGRCDGMLNDLLSLQRDKVSAPKPDNYAILPDILSKESDGLMVRSGDSEWEKLVRWTFFALVQAEEYGLTKDNVEEIRKTTSNPDIRRFLGVEGNLGKGFGISDSFAYDIVRHVGNYGEVFERNLGKAGGIGAERGLNKTWRDGGLMISQMWQ